MQVGDKATWERTFTEEDVRLFMQLSGDQGIHHMVPDEHGRLMVHGLLTAAISTKMGGDLNFIARDISFEFIRPVFVGEAIHCTNTIVHVEQVAERIQMASTFTCLNPQGKEVMRGRASGIIRVSAADHLQQA